MRKDDLVYLKHILDAILRIEEYVNNVNNDTFSRNNLLQDGVIRQIEIIGEATKRLSKDCTVSDPFSPKQKFFCHNF